jgi:uncharacterized protein YjaG (DUF416 family)
VTLAPDVRLELEQLGGEHRIVFAASCCERLLPAYEAFSNEDGWGNPSMLREAVDAVWAALPGSRLDEADARRLVAELEEQIPNLDDPFTSVFAAPGQNAAIAVVRCVQCGESASVEHAGQVADSSIDSFEAYVDQTEGEGPVYDEERVTSSSVYRGEVSDQQHDLATLAEHAELDSELIDEIRSRSRASGFAKVVPSRR